VCRNISDGSLVFAVNCDDYKLDTSANLLGDSTTICRCKPFILGDAVYLCNSVVTNIGPQVYAVNKNNGSLLWAAAYYTPDGAPSYVTTVGDYSAYIGKTHRISDMNPVADYFKDMNGNIHKYVFVGISSFQNAINFTAVMGGFPKCTDQGFLFCIEDHGNSSSLVWKVPTCAPLINVGDTLTKGGPAHLDPFRPSEDRVLIQTTSSSNNNFLNPYYLDENSIYPGIVGLVPFIVKVNFTNSTTIDNTLVQTIWQSIGEIYVDSDRTHPHNLEELLSMWETEKGNLANGEVASHIIWAFVDSNIVSLAQGQSGNHGIIYFKYLNDNHTVDNIDDAYGLNYYGNSTWGAAPLIDKENNTIYFGSGQGHDIILDESLFYSNRNRNFLDVKVPYIDQVNGYLDGDLDFKDLEKGREGFENINQTIVFNTNDKSPRGRMSYSDGIFGVYINDFMSKNGLIVGGTIAFATRTTQWDTFTFLSDEPKVNVYPIRALDGDASSGLQLFKKNGKLNISTSTKSGVSLTLDLKSMNNDVIFNHNNLKSKGVKIVRYTLSGPAGALGGSNFQCDASDSTLVCAQGNMAWFSGGFSSTGSPEKHITQDGKLYDVNNSFLEALDMKSGEILWEKCYYNRAHAQVKIHNSLIFTQDDTGSLYVHDLNNGDLLWKYNGSRIGLNGGIVAPSISNMDVVWTNNYNAFGIIGSAGKYGAIFTINEDLSTLVQYNLMSGRYFVSWDCSSKVTPNVAVRPVTEYHIVNQWANSTNYYSPNYLTATHVIGLNEPEVYQFSIQYYDGLNKTFYFQQNPVGTGKTVNYQYARLYNRNVYEVLFNEYHDGVKGPDIFAWLEINNV
jgi:hypothetical protein